MRAYISATIGFEGLAEATGPPSESLVRMLGPLGNPTAGKLFNILQTVQRTAGLHLSVGAER